MPDMGVGEAVAISSAIAALTATGSAVMANQQTQHAKGAAQAQDTAMQQQVVQADDQTKATQTQQSQIAQAGAAQKMAAALASMTASGGMGGTNTGASNAPLPQTQAGATLLGS